MLRSFAVVAGLSLFVSCAAWADEPQTYPLWPTGAPGAAGSEVGDLNHSGDIPTITVYLRPRKRRPVRRS